jgi:hypothetical protein
MYASSPKPFRPLNMRFLKNPFLLHGENMTRTSIPNFKSIRCVVFEIQRSVSQWYLDFIYIDYTNCEYTAPNTSNKKASRSYMVLGLHALLRGMLWNLKPFATSTLCLCFNSRNRSTRFWQKKKKKQTRPLNEIPRRFDLRTLVACNHSVDDGTPPSRLVLNVEK